MNSLELAALRNLTTCRSVIGLFKDCNEMPAITKEVYSLKAFVFLFCAIYGIVMVMETLVDHYGGRKIREITDRNEEVEPHPTRPGWVVIQFSWVYKVLAKQIKEKEKKFPKKKKYQPILMPLCVQHYNEILDHTVLISSNFFLATTALDMFYFSTWPYYLLLASITIFAIIRVFTEVIVIFHSLFSVYIYLLHLLPKSVLRIPEDVSKGIITVITSFVVIKEFYLFVLLALSSTSLFNCWQNMFYCYVGLHAFLYSLTIMSVMTRFLPGRVAYEKLSFYSQQHVFQIWTLVILKTVVLNIVTSSPGFNVQTLCMVWILADAFLVPIVRKLGRMWFKIAIIAREPKPKQAPPLPGKQSIVV